MDNNYSIKYRKNKALTNNSNIINANYIYSIENDKFLSMIDIYTGSIGKIIIIEFPEFPWNVRCVFYKCKNVQARPWILLRCIFIQ